MNSSVASPRERLIQILGGIAMYNDKGFEWSGHSPARVAEEQRKAQAQIERLVIEIGECKFPTEVLSDLKSGAASQDASGIFKRKVEQCLPPT